MVNSKKKLNNERIKYCGTVTTRKTKTKPDIKQNRKKKLNKIWGNNNE